MAPRRRRGCSRSGWGRKAFAAAALLPALRGTGLVGAGASLLSPELPPLNFGVLANWGGTNTPPYTTPGQLAAAAALEAVATKTGMSFVVSAGGNFLPDGLPGAPLAAPQNRRRRQPERLALECAGGARSAPPDRNRPPLFSVRPGGWTAAAGLRLEQRASAGHGCAG
jgi:hypothetical protein